MRRRIFHCSAAISALMLLVVLALWVRSYWRSNAIVYQSGKRHVALQWLQGIAAIGADNISTPRRQILVQGWNVFGKHFSVGYGWSGKMGFSCEVQSFSSAGVHVPYPTAPLPAIIHSRVVTMPLWFIALLLTVLPVKWIMGWRRWRRAARTGCCKICGYDLRATRDRCPECGTPVNAAGATG